jgi:AraC-like DNA-binding protein
MFSASEVQSRAVLPQVQFALPAPALRPLITTYYRVEAHAALQDHLHPEWGNVRFTVAGRWQVERPGCSDPTPERGALFGPTDRSGIVSCDGAGVTVGAGLTAQGWSLLIGTPAHVLANRIADLEKVHAGARALWQALQDADWETTQALFDAYFTGLMATASPADPLIGRLEAILVTGDVDHVADLAARLGISDRTLERLCKRVFGFSPKRLLRRQRFLRSLAEIGDRLDQPLAVLLDGSYFDQSHFIREFKAYMGMTPTAYFHSPRQMMRRAAAERLRTAGATVQGLHIPLAG